MQSPSNDSRGAGQAGLCEVLQERFGFSQFKPGQREVIEHLMAGRSAAAVFPTGGGKSLCYQVPALLLPGLVRSLYDRLLQRESWEIERLGQVAVWVEHDGCQVARLGEHFGDSLPQPCGHCSWCLAGGKLRRLPPRPEPRIDPQLWPQVEALRREHAEEFRDPRSLARFLCGVSSPWLVRAKLQSHRWFGALSDVPFPIVLQQASGKAM